MKKVVSVSGNIIDSRTKSRLMKVVDDGVTTLYIARSSADTMDNDGYTIVTPVNQSDTRITTPILKLDNHGKIDQMYRGLWVGDTDVYRMDYVEITYFHPSGIKDFLNVLSMTEWFVDDEEGSAFSIDDDIENNDVIINVKINVRGIKSVSYLMKYEEDIGLYKLYLIEKVDF